jgi:D-glycero-D-manno-heptose 1,7-bisphosphate phosphatase
MKLTLLDRDGVVVVNRATNIKAPADLSLIEGAAEGIGHLNAAGFTVAICTNQPEVARGAMTLAELQQVHEALDGMLRSQGAVIDRIFSCTNRLKCPRRKPAAGMLREALAHYGARAEETPFVGDQADDLRAAFHAGCQRVLVQTGLGAKAVASGLPDYVRPVTVCENLYTAAVAIVRSEKQGAEAPRFPSHAR